MKRIAKTVATLVVGGVVLAAMTNSASAAFTSNGQTLNALSYNALSYNALSYNALGRNGEQAGFRLGLGSAVQSIELGNGTVVELR